MGFRDTGYMHLSFYFPRDIGYYPFYFQGWAPQGFWGSGENGYLFSGI